MRKFLGFLLIAFFATYVLGGCGGGSGGGNPKTPLLPETPTAVYLSSPSEVDAFSLNLTWSQNNDGDFASYKIYTSLYPGVTQSANLVLTVTTNQTVTKKISGLAIGTKYYLRVYVCNGSDLCSGSNEVSVKTNEICDDNSDEIGKSCDDETLQEEIDDFLKTRFPPEMLTVSLSPEQPVAGEFTSIIVNIGNPENFTKDETTKVTFYYSKDFSQTWNVIELTPGDGATWYGEMPPFNSGDEVIYSIRAVDTSSNVFISIGCKTDKEWDLDPSIRVDSDCVSNDISTCENATPRWCLFRIAGDDLPGDDDESMPSWGDLVDYRFGYDDENLYIDIAAEGNIDGGTLSPTDVHVYAVAIVNTERAKTVSSIDELVSEGGLLVFAPLLKQYESAGFFSDCYMRYQASEYYYIDANNIKCLNKSNHLLYVVPWSTANTIGITESDSIQLFGFSGAITDITNVNQAKGYYLDKSHATNIVIDDNYFFVE